MHFFCVARGSHAFGCTTKRATMPALDTAFRRSDTYKQWVTAIRADHPNLPQYLVDMAIYTHLNEPQIYKQYCKNRARPAVEKKAEQAIVEIAGAVSVLDADDPSLKVEPIPVAAFCDTQG